MTFHLESKHQNLGKLRGCGVSRVRKWAISKEQNSENSKLLEFFACAMRVLHRCEEWRKIIADHIHCSINRSHLRTSLRARS